MLKILVTVLFPFSYTLHSDYFTNSTSYVSCPLDQFWDKTKRICKECDPGFYGNNCFEACRYPNYGVDCQKRCDCSERICSNVFGCHRDNGTTESSNLDENVGQSNFLAKFAIITALVTGFLIVIICIVAASVLTRRHFTNILITSEKNINSVLAGHTMNLSRVSSLDRWDSGVPQLSRYEQLSIV